MIPVYSQGWSLTLLFMILVHASLFAAAADSSLRSTQSEQLSRTCTDLSGTQVRCPEVDYADREDSRDQTSRSFNHPELLNFRLPDSGSAYVALDSWVYPVMDRLVALGYVRSSIAGLRPWTRVECARLLAEAGEEFQELANDGAGFEGSTMRALRAEFRPELMNLAHRPSVKLESVYMRLTQISGLPLTDSYHFAQTISNDFGRPYANGMNNTVGVSTRATAGRFVFYFRGEFQHAPGNPDPIERPLTSVYADEDQLTPLPPRTAIPEVNRLTALEAYVGYSLKNWQFTFGKQSLYWGPSRSGALLWSNNAEPVTTFRLSRMTPFKLPSILRLVGPIRTEFFVGRLQGHHLVRTKSGLVGSYSETLSNQPFVYAQKLSFKPTPNLEIGMSHSAVFGGPGLPVTTGNTLRALFSTGNVFGIGDPGDRRSGFDLSYRPPGLRKWLTVYLDSMAEDEGSPAVFPWKAAINPGFYVPRVPKIPKLDFRAEGIYTDLPGLRHTGYFYWNSRYVNGYTNHGEILGNPVGRQGRGLQFWSSYWVSPKSLLGITYRNQRVNEAFLQGGRIDDLAAKANLMVKRNLELRTSVQVERWKFPLLHPNRHINVSSTFQLTYLPD
jgi:hypothetical protein